MTAFSGSLALKRVTDRRKTVIRKRYNLIDIMQKLLRPWILIYGW